MPSLFSAVAVLLAGLGLLGWVTPWRALARVHPESIPMAPSTAMALLLLGGALILDARRPSPRFRAAVSALVSAFACTELVRFALGLPPVLDSFLVPAPQMLGTIPTARISPLTAFGLLCAGLSLLLAGLARDRALLGALGALLALGVSLLGAVVTLGYLFGTPLLYGGALVPMAFPTALAVGCIGFELVALAPRDTLPLRPFVGGSVRARLLRAFLPAALLIIGVGLLFGRLEGWSAAAHAALASLVSAAVISAFVYYAARGMGRELERAERERKESESALRLFFESDVAGIAFGDAERVQEANDAFLRITGYSREDVEARRVRWAGLTPPEFRESDGVAQREAFARGACAPYEKQYLRKDGTRVWVMVSYVILDRPTGYNVGFVVDIDARKRAEDDLRRSEERFARVFRSNLFAIGMAEMESGRLVDVNNRCAEFFGYTRDEMIGRTVFELGIWVKPSDRARLVAAATAPGSARPMEVAFRSKSGEIRHALVSMEAMALSGIGEQLNMVSLVDVTEHKLIESQLLQAQKLEAVGRLAGGIAHDFNNLLGVILGYGDLLLRRASEAQRGKLEQILKAAERAAALTGQLLAFSRKQVVEPKVLDLNAFLVELEKMLGRLIGEDVELAIVPGAALGQVRADPGQLNQVLMNLCVNARDAMPDGGLLRLETANVDVDASEAARNPPMAPGRYVLVSVTDTGCGIGDEDLSKLFEPFFTTKGPGKGTGLGLATAYGIVKQAGGFVWVASAVGRGTTFKVYLPRIDEPVAPLEGREPTLPGRGSETVLLVEDEASLREITREILEEHGYVVLEAASGNDAVEVGRRHPDPIDLLLTDVVMPGMNGRLLADSLMSARPSLKVLYMSGYTDDVIAHRGVLDEGTLLLAKPFTAQALLQRVRGALGPHDIAEEA